MKCFAGLTSLTPSMLAQEGDLRRQSCKTEIMFKIISTQPCGFCSVFKKEQITVKLNRMAVLNCRKSHQLILLFSSYLSVSKEEIDCKGIFHVLSSLAHNFTCNDKLKTMSDNLVYLQVTSLDNNWRWFQCTYCSGERFSSRCLMAYTKFIACCCCDAWSCLFVCQQAPAACSGTVQSADLAELAGILLCWNSFED